MDGQIRVRTDRRHARIYNELKNLVVGDFHELFFVCACLAYRHGQRKSLGSNREDRFWSKTITPREWACFYAMVLDQSGMDFEAIREDKDVISMVEEYANAGMEILLNGFLRDYTLASPAGPQLDPGVRQELPKVFLHHLFDQMEAPGSP